MADVISPNQARILVSELIDLRTKLGESAFVEHKTVAAVLEIAKVRKGQAARVRAEATTAKAAQIAAESALKSTVPGFGPRGGLPRDKPSLIRLCKECGLSQDGLIGELRERLTEYVDLIGRNDRERSIKTLEQAEQEVREEADTQGDLEVRRRLGQALAMSSMGQQGDPSMGTATALQSGSAASSSQAPSLQQTPGQAIVVTPERLDALIAARLTAAGVLWQKDVERGLDQKLTASVTQVLTQHQPMGPQMKKEQMEVSHADLDRVTRTEMAEVAKNFKELLRGKTPCKIEAKGNTAFPTTMSSGEMATWDGSQF